MKRHPNLILFLLAAFLFSLPVANTQASILSNIGLEEDAWSDMAFPIPTVSGSYDSGSLDLTATASPSNNLDIGSGFASDYGTGTAKGPFSATLSVNGVEIDNTGTVTAGGTVSIIFNGSLPTGLAGDYGISPGDVLLQGTVTEAALNATGSDTLDLLFLISGGALQDGGTNGLGPLNAKFAPSGYGVLRFGSIADSPLDFSGSFSLDGSSLNVFGIPEPSSLMLISVTLLGLAGGSRNKNNKTIEV